MGNNFSEKKRELFDSLGESRIMCLATSENDRVTARSMSFIILGEKFYFQTDTGFLKYRQLTANPKAAISFSNISFECECRELSHPLLPENSFFSEKFRRHFESSFEAYTKNPREVLIEAVPIKASVWGYENEKPYQEFYDFEAHTFRREYYI